MGDVKHKGCPFSQQERAFQGTMRAQLGTSYQPLAISREVSEKAYASLVNAYLHVKDLMKYGPSQTLLYISLMIPPQGI